MGRQVGDRLLQRHAPVEPAPAADVQDRSTAAHASGILRDHIPEDPVPPLAVAIALEEGNPLGGEIHEFGAHSAFSTRPAPGDSYATFPQDCEARPENQTQNAIQAAALRIKKDDVTE